MLLRQLIIYQFICKPQKPLVVYIILGSPARGASPPSCLILSTILGKLAQMQLTER
jgi:hypothetical protein